MMHPRAVLLSLLSILALLPSCASKAGGPEKLIMPRPIPLGSDGWTQQSGKDSLGKFVLWSTKGQRLRLTISEKARRMSPEAMRASIEGGARDGTATGLRSQILRQGMTNGYPALLWQNSATLANGVKTVNLLLYIQGNDAGYLLQRRWDRASVSESEMQRWRAYFQTISACDPGDSRHPCPAMVPVPKGR
jgi:hypothetical protein